MKLKIKADKLRILSEFYGIPIQSLARKAEIAWIRARQEFSGKYDKGGSDVTVIDVDDDRTPDEWREVLDYYATREIELLPTVIQNQINLEKAKAEQIRKELPAYYEV